MAASSSEWVEGSHVWIANQDPFSSAPYVLATVVEIFEDGTDGTTLTVEEVETGKRHTKYRSELSAANADASKNNAPDDHCGLGHLNEATLLEATRARAEFGAPYTWCGASQLLSINPCEPVDGGPSVMAFFRNRTREIGEAEPHAYAVAEAACARLHRQRRVAVLVSGESGAGKTEASRLVVQYLVWRAARVEAAGGGVAGSITLDALREGVLASNTVLESLGNARMIANGNSSRFGKHTLLRIEPAQTADAPISLLGASVDCFLLERCRLCTIAPGERNFHSLYYLLAGARRATFGGHPSTLLAEGYGGLPRDFAYLRSTVERGLEPQTNLISSIAALASGSAATPGTAPQVGSGEAASESAEVTAAAEGFARLHAALAQLGVGAQGEAALHRLLRGVLLLGQLEFKDGEQPAYPPLPCDQTAIDALTTLLGEDVLADLLGRSIASPRSGTTLTKEHSASQARSARDSLAMGLYQAAFDAAIKFLNAALSPSENGSNNAAHEPSFAGPSRGIALLDVFGFEVLQTNSLEQLLINYTNEKLHQHFLKCTLKEEERVYAQEGVGAFIPPAAVHSNAPSPTSKAATATPGKAAKTPAQKNPPKTGGSAGSSKASTSVATRAPSPAKIATRTDNEELIRLIEARPSGLFACLESTCRLPNGNDNSFVRDLFAQNELAKASNLLRPPRNAAATAGRRALKPDDGFQLAHFHSNVQYDAAGFINKNQDALSANLSLVVERQAAKLWRELVADARADSGVAAGGGGSGGGVAALRRGGKAPTSLSEGHRTRLATLLSSLDPEESGVHNFFIKCVKPNERMRPAAFHAGYVLRQLRHQGVLQAVAIIKGGFPHRISYNEVHGRYAHLLTQLAASAAPGTQVFASIGPRGLVCALLAAEELTEGTDYVLGRTRVFLRLGKAQLLERMLSLPPKEVLPDLEKRLRQHAARVRAKATLRLVLRVVTRRRRIRREREERAAKVMKAWARGFVWRQRIKKLRKQKAEEEARRAAMEEAAAKAAAEEAARSAEREEAAARAAAAEAARAAEAEAALALAAAEAAAVARDELIRMAVKPHMPIFFESKEVIAKAEQQQMMPSDLALDPRLHQLLFAHWDWAAPGAGEGPTTTGGTLKLRRPLLAGRGENSKGLTSQTPPERGRKYDGEGGQLTSARLREAAGPGSGLLGWLLLAVLVAAYFFVAALPILHGLGVMPSELVFWPGGEDQR